MQTLQLEGEMENKGVCRPRETMVCIEKIAMRRTWGE